jgi:hypothetical protein
MNDKTLKTVKEFEGSIYWPHEITPMLQAGWHYIGYRLKREVKENGSFEEEFIHLLGHESENP